MYLMAKGQTADELFGEFKRVDSKIKRIRREGIRESSTLDCLLKQSGKLITKLDDCLSNGGRLLNPLMDYCFARLSDGYSYINHLGRRDSEDVFEVIPLVSDFLKDIKNNIDEKILETYDDIPKRLGVISGNCFFEVDEDFRRLCVPVRNFVEFKNGKWQEGRLYKNKGIEINADIFSYPANSKILGFAKIVSNFMNKEGINGARYETDHSGIKYIGGHGPKETTIYIGNRYINDFFKDKEITIRTEKKIKVTIPNLG